MRKIATSTQLSNELLKLLAFSKQPNPSRITIARRLRKLADKVETSRKPGPTASTVVTAAMPEPEFWKTIEHYGWGTKTRADKAIKKDLMSKLSPEQADDLNATFRQLKSKLYKALSKKVEGLGDDGFDDLLSHIIGMGKKEYDAAMKDPEVANKRAENGDFTESFAYAIPDKSDYKSLDVNKYVTWAEEVVKEYEMVLKADEDDIPWLPKMKGDLNLVIDAMKAFIKDKDFHALIKEEAKLKAASEKVGEYLNKLNVGWMPEKDTLEDAIRQVSNKWAVWNLISDLKDFLG